MFAHSLHNPLQDGLHQHIFTAVLIINKSHGLFLNPTLFSSCGFWQRWPPEILLTLEVSCPCLLALLLLMFLFVSWPSCLGKVSLSSSVISPSPAADPLHADSCQIYISSPDFLLSSRPDDAIPQKQHLPVETQSLPIFHLRSFQFLPIQQIILNSFYVPGAVLGTGDTAVNKTGNPCLIRVTSKEWGEGRETISKISNIAY